MKTGSKIALTIGGIAMVALAAIPGAFMLRTIFGSRRQEPDTAEQIPVVSTEISAETTAETTETTADTTADVTGDTTSETTAETTETTAESDDEGMESTAEEVPPEEHVVYANLSEATIENLRSFRADWYDLAEYFADRSNAMPGVTISQDAAEVFPNRRSPFFEDNWFAVYEDIIYGDPYCFHALEDGMHLQFTGGIVDGRAYPVTDMPREEYDKDMEKLEKSWNSFMDGMRELTAGRDTLESAMVVSESICARCFYDTKLENRSMRLGLTKKRTTCMGYTNWFNSAMRELGYLVTTVRSEDLEHIWSAVYVPEQGRWAEIDVTWVDGMLLAAKNIAIPDYRNICYFDFSSRDPDAYPEHYCEDQVTLAELTASPSPITYEKRGWGYQFINNQNPNGVYAKKIMFMKEGGFRIYWSDGSGTNASL